MTQDGEGRLELEREEVDAGCCGGTDAAEGPSAGQG